MIDRVRLAALLRRIADRLSPPQGDYIAAATTVAEARTRGMTVEEYVEEQWGQPGQTAAIVRRMSLERTDTVVEIGPGTGRYLARVREIAKPRRHVIFETAPDWRSWLVSEYRVEAPEPDGEGLTGVDAAGLIHAHGVFVCTPYLVTARYLAEMERVGTDRLVFDFCSPTDLDVERWLASEHRYPVVLDRDWVLSRLPSFALVDEWTTPYGMGQSRYVVLRRSRR